MENQTTEKLVNLISNKEAISKEMDFYFTSKVETLRGLYNAAEVRLKYFLDCYFPIEVRKMLVEYINSTATYLQNKKQMHIEGMSIECIENHNYKILVGFDKFLFDSYIGTDYHKPSFGNPETLEQLKRNNEEYKAILKMESLLNKHITEIYDILDEFQKSKLEKYKSSIDSINIGNDEEELEI